MIASRIGRSWRSALSCWPWPTNQAWIAADCRASVWWLDLVKWALAQALLQLLIDNAPIENRQEVSRGLLNGPQIKLGNTDVVDDQGQVDDLLASLGF